MNAQDVSKSGGGDGGTAVQPTAAGAKPVSAAKAAIVLMIGVLFLAFTAIFVKQSNFEPITSAFLRCFLALLMLLPFGFWEIKQKGMLSKTGIILSIIAGLFLGVDFMAWNFSIFTVGAGIASVLLNLQVIIVPLLAVVFDKLRVERTFLVILPIMIIGVILTGGVFEPSPTVGPTTLWGIDIALVGTLLGSTSGVCYSFYLYFSRKAGVVNPGRYIQPMVLVSGAQCIPPAIIMPFTHRGLDLTHGVMAGGVLPMNPESSIGDPITGMSWFWMFLLALTGQALAWLFVQYGSVNMDPTLAAGLLLLSPVSTVAFIAPFTHHEIPSILQTIGVITVLACVAVQNKLHLAVLNKLRR